MEDQSEQARIDAFEKYILEGQLKYGCGFEAVLSTCGGKDCVEVSAKIRIIPINLPETK